MKKKMYIGGYFVDLIKQGKFPKIVFVGSRCLWTEQYDEEYDEYYYETLCKQLSEYKYGEYCPFCGLKIVVEEYRESAG